MNASFIVAGNGPSLARVAPGRLVVTDRIIRTNSFFLEPNFYLGSRVDLALITGDPRVAPFVFASLRQALNQYHLNGWSADSKAGQVTGRRYLAQDFTRFRVKDRHLQNAINSLTASFQRMPTTGIKAVILAHALGAERIVLAGIDLYDGPSRYVFQPGRHMCQLLGPDLATRSYDTRLHSADLDRAVLDLIAKRDDVNLYRSCDKGALAQFLDLAPERVGPALPQPNKRPIDDWVGMAGIYPIAALKILRRLRYFQRGGMASMREFCGR